MRTMLNEARRCEKPVPRFAICGLMYFVNLGSATLWDLDEGRNMTCAWEMMESGKLPRVTWEKIIEHIEHAVKIAGIDHVGLGSDFDGATMPMGMEDTSKLPQITEALLKKGHSRQDINKILGGNVLRVMEQVESKSRALN